MKNRQQTGVTQDGFLDGRLRILQPAHGHRSGLDAVMLAASIPAKAGESVLEAGAGVGVMALCLAWRVAGVQVRGIEIQPDLVSLAAENSAANALANAVVIHQGDVTARRSALAPEGIVPGTFDHVMANPPFYDAGTVSPSPDSNKRRAHVTRETGLVQWVEYCCAMARPRGSVSFIHRADHLASLIRAMGTRLGAVIVYPLWPETGKPASRVLVRGIKGAGGALTLCPGLVLHTPDGAPGTGAQAVLRGGEALDINGS